jgi:two-component system NarL family response regulator
MPIKVMIADDHVIVREGIRALLSKWTRELAIIGEASDGKGLLELARKKPADVYVLDIAMPGLNGIETAARLLRLDKNAKIIYLSMYNDKPTVQKALEAGAHGYLLKENAGEDIVKAIRAVHGGGYYVSAALSGFMLDRLHRAPGPGLKGEPASRLTPKEREIIQLIAEGLADKEISRRLHISGNTVHAHRNNISRKLDIHKQTDLVRYAIKEKIAVV